jgi:apolipoprotein N-acyltransferase
VVTALSVPPFGWWVLGPVGLAGLCHRLGGRGWRPRVACGVAFGAGLYGVGLAWVKEFSVPGMVVWMAFTAVLTGGLAALVPPGRGRWLGFPAVLVVTELVRQVWPFGGLPLSGIDLGQSGGPLAPVVAIGGRLLLVGVTATAGVALAAAPPNRNKLVGLGAGLVVVVVAAAGWLAPAGHRVGTVRVAVVQGGGRRGIPAREADPDVVFGAQVAATGRVGRPVDLVLWPEDVIDVDRLAGSPQAAAVAGLARRLRTTIVAGVVEEAGAGRFRNFVVAWGPDGRQVARYEKVHRVPFGEYFPARRLLERFATLPGEDARPGPHRPGTIATPAGRFGVVISYEVFFQGRARSAVDRRAGALLVPTNASSFTTGQMPAQELAAARLRAWQTGRDVLQASPTGYSALIGHRGVVRRHTDLGARQVVQGTITARQGVTPYDRTGDGPPVALAAAVLAAAWLVERRPAPRSRT